MPTFKTDEPIAVSIAVSRAVIRIVAGDRTDTIVTVHPGDRNRPEDVEAAEKTVVDLSNGTLSIKQQKPGGIAAPVIGWKRRGALDVTVELPEGSSLRADTGFADFGCEGRLGDVEVRTGAGNIRLDRTGALVVHSGAGHVTVGEASGRARIVTAGDITVGAVAGDADVKNHNGRTWIGRVGGDAQVRSANGDVTIDEAGADVAARTANGDIRLGQVVRGSVTGETAAGRIDVGIREGTAAWIDAVTRFGTVHNDLAPVGDPEASAETVTVQARTSYGDVFITRASVPQRQGEA